MSDPICLSCGNPIPEDKISLLGRCEKTLGRCICIDCKFHFQPSSKYDLSAPGPKLSVAFLQFVDELRVKLPGWNISTLNEDESRTFYAFISNSAEPSSSYTAHVPAP